MRPMQKSLLSSLVFALPLSLAAVSAAQAGEQDFTLINDTGVEIHELYVAPSSTDNWEEDILGRDTLPDGESVDIRFSRKEKTAEWDLKVVDGEGDSIEWTELDLTEISAVTLHFKNGEATADIE